MTTLNTPLAIPQLLKAYQEQRFTPRELMFSLREQALAQADYNAWIYLLSTDELDRFLAVAR